MGTCLKEIQPCFSRHVNFFSGGHYSGGHYNFIRKSRVTLPRWSCKGWLYWWRRPNVPSFIRIQPHTPFEFSGLHSFPINALTSTRCKVGNLICIATQQLTAEILYLGLCVAGGLSPPRSCRPMRNLKNGINRVKRKKHRPFRLSNPLSPSPFHSVAVQAVSASVSCLLLSPSNTRRP